MTKTGYNQAVSGLTCGSTVEGPHTFAGSVTSGIGQGDNIKVSDDGSGDFAISETAPTGPTTSVTPGQAAVVSTTAGSTPVVVAVPPQTQIATVTVTAPPEAYPVTVPVAHSQLAAVVVKAYDSSGALQTSFATSPLTVTLVFAGTTTTLPAKAEIDTIDPATGDTQRLATTVSQNSDGTWTASAQTTHLSPFVVTAPETAGAVTTILGGPASGPATQLAQGPEAIAVDSTSGVLYVSSRVASNLGGVVYAVDPSTGQESVVAGSGDVPGTYPVPSGPEPALSAQLDVPTGLAVDHSGNLYLSDSGVVSVLSGGTLTPFAGGGSPTDGLGDGLPATEAQLSAGPLAVDGAGNVFIVDSNHNSVREVAAGTGIISTVPGSDTLGQPQFVAVDASGDLFVTALSGVSGTLNEFPASGGAPVTIWSGSGSDILNGLSVDATGDIYATNSADQVVELTSTATNSPTSTTSTTAGTPSTTTTTGASASPPSTTPAPAAPPYNPPAVIAGTGTAGFSGDGGPAISAELDGPTALATYGGTVYVLDALNLRVRGVTGGSIDTVAGDGEASLGLPGQAPEVPLVNPAALAIVNGTTYVVADDGMPTVLQVAPSGAASQLPVTGLHSVNDEANWKRQGAKGTPILASDVVDMSSDPSGNLLFADAGQGLVLRYNPTSTTAATQLRGPGEYVTSKQMDTAGGAGTNVYGGITGIAVDPAGDVFVADSYQNRGAVWQVTPSNTLIAYLTNLPQPTGGLAFNGGNLYVATGAGILKVSGQGQYQQITNSPALTVRFDGAGTMYSGDAGYAYRWTNGAATPVAGTGAPGFSADGQAATATAFSGFQQFIFDSAGDMLVADSANNRVREVVAPF
ncbi:MAG TPA: hypothetical protein VE990_08250 [Acidimicrobiales bacterium]|nr:hypothetical protein [Acidimicrobiales bacterium]